MNKISLIFLVFLSIICQNVFSSLVSIINYRIAIIISSLSLNESFAIAFAALEKSRLNVLINFYLNPGILAS